MPVFWLYVLSLAVPLVLMPVINLIFVRSFHDWHISWLGRELIRLSYFARLMISDSEVLLTWGVTDTVTNIVKLTVGRPRPGKRLLPSPLVILLNLWLADLIDRCQPAAGSVNAAVFGLATFTICTQTDKGILREGWRSFPSGHSSCKRSKPHTRAAWTNTHDCTSVVRGPWISRTLLRWETKAP